MADLLLFAVIGPLLLCSIRADDFVLTVLHTNDIHAHIEQFNTYGGNCVEGEECFGGVARKHTLVQKMRAEKPNVILLDGGDEFSGTLWFNIYKGRAAVTFMNYTKYDAMVSWSNNKCPLCYDCTDLLRRHVKQGWEQPNQLNYKT